MTKCQYNNACKLPAEFKLYPEVPDEVSNMPFIREMASTLESEFCAGHLRIQLKKDHEQGIQLCIDRL